YPNLVPYAVERTRGTNVKVAAVATAFPSGQSSMDVKLLETREVIDAGAHEVDMVINRGAFLSGRYAEVYDEVVRVKEVCAGRADPSSEAGGAVPRSSARDPRPGVADSRSVSPRSVDAPERRAHADT